jgi:hypothetical protein
VELAKWAYQHGFNCQITMPHSKRRWGFKVMYYLCDSSEHESMPLSDEVMSRLVDIYNDKTNVDKNPNFLRLYHLLFK